VQTDKGEIAVMEISGTHAKELGIIIAYLFKNRISKNLKRINFLQEFLSFSFPLYSANKEEFCKILVEIKNDLEQITPHHALLKQEIDSCEEKLNDVVFNLFQLSDKKEYISNRVMCLGYLSFGDLVYEQEGE
jgi:hypothetical protein